MLQDVVEDPGRTGVAEQLHAHVAELGRLVEAVGIDACAEAADLPASTVTALADGDVETAADLDLEAVAAIHALEADAPGAAAILAEAREDLLLGMTVGILSVDEVASDVDMALEPREIQGLLEGRRPMSLRAYVELSHVIANRRG